MKKFKEFFTNIEWSTVEPAVIVRYILAIVAAINLILKYTGVVPIEVNENIVYNVVSIVLTVIVIIMNTYKNNSTSPQAIIADSIMRLLKASAEVDPKESNNALEAINAILSNVKDDMVAKTGVDITDNDTDIRGVDAVGLEDIDGPEEAEYALDYENVGCDDEVDEETKEKYFGLMAEYAATFSAPELADEIKEIGEQIEAFIHERLFDAAVVTPIMNEDGVIAPEILESFYRDPEDEDDPDAIRFTGSIELYRVVGTGDLEGRENDAVLEEASEFVDPLIAKLEAKYGLELLPSFIFPVEKTTEEDPGTFGIRVGGPIED